MKPSFASLPRYLILLLLSALAVGPFAWLLVTALRGSQEAVFSWPPSFWPASPTLSHFIDVWRAAPMGDYLINSMAMSTLAVGCNVFLSVLAGYPLARMHFAGKQLLLVLIILAMLLPFQVLLIPLYLLFQHLGLSGDGGGLLGSWLPHRLAAWVGMALPFAVSSFGMLMVRQTLLSIPASLEESAVLEGCNSLQLLWHVHLPQLRATLSVLAIFTFMAVWGELLWPSVLVGNGRYYPFSVGLVQLQGLFSTNWRLIAAGTLLSILPVLMVFMVAQRQFMSGSLEGAVKG
ncbi:MAG: carbohydrate ABC transporter permease [Vampirovibrionales bacterium]|nr:carbohydrate ABC transporter permease [Vampirovibrionales bacterium]